MKILFVSHEATVNGSTRSMMTLISKLKQEHGAQIEVMVPHDKEAAAFVREQGITCYPMLYYPDYHKIGKLNPIKELIKKTVNAIRINELKKKFKDSSFDYIISNSCSIDIGARLARELNVKHVFYIREFMEEDYSFEFTNKELMRELIEGSHKVIFISQAIADKYRKIYNIRDSRVIYNGVNTDEYYYENHEILKDDVIKLIQVGSLLPGKRALETLQYVNKLKDNHNIRVSFLGNGDEAYISELKQYVNENNMNDNVEFLGHSRYVGKILSKYDILVMNSKAEGFGRVTAEGMINGLLAFGKNSGGTSEIISDENLGVLFEDEDSFVAKMEDVFANRAKYCEIAKNGQKSAMERFSPENNVRNVWEFLN